jgi:hypothetical protein
MGNVEDVDESRAAPRNALKYFANGPDEYLRKNEDDEN